MSGHSKWANIKRRKGKQDAVRGKIFTKIGKEIFAAARAGGGEPENNLRLRNALDKAKEANMPQDTIARTIKKATGELDGVNYEEIVYEGYGPAGVAVLINILTDNRNRTAAEIRHIFSKHGGNLGETGCVAWMFEQKGVITFEKEGLGKSADDIMLLALDAGADDIKEDADVIEVVTDPSQFEGVKAALEAAGLKATEAEITMVPQTTVQLTGKDAEKMLKMMDLLEEHDDVQDVFANFDIPDEIYELMD